MSEIILRIVLHDTERVTGYIKQELFSESALKYCERDKKTPCFRPTVVINNARNVFSPSLTLDCEVHNLNEP
jgi:hypothetical protein